MEAPIRTTNHVEEGTRRGGAPAAAWACLLLLAIAGCRASPTTRHETPPDREVRRITIDLLALDLATCGRCVGSDRNLDAALRTVTKRLSAEGVEVRVQKTVVTTAEQAVALRFESSPTIRVDGRDISMETRESRCGDCGDLCGGAVGVDCRVWLWRGKEYLEAPEPLIVDAVLRAYRDGPAPRSPPTTPFHLPDNLRRFFQARG